MFQSWRLKLREVDESLKVGRLDEAFQMLNQGGLLEYLPAKKLAERLALLYTERAKRRALDGDQLGGWKDLEAALSLGQLPACDVARRCLIEAGLNDVEGLVRGGDLAAATRQLDQLEKHAPTHPQIQSWRHVVRALHAARNLIRHGKFADAEAQLDVALALRPGLSEIAQWREECQARGSRGRSLSEQLYQALAGSAWERVVTIAEELLALAPDWKLARDARGRAWRQLGSPADRLNTDSTHILGVRARSPEVDELATDAPPSRRFLLWVDGVGGYLVCLDEEVMLGQHVPGSRADIPVLGDLSRNHARIRRSGEGYVIEPIQVTKINGRTIRGPTALCNADEIGLGGVKFRFSRPHALSATARLDPISPHRTQPAADGILLMAESCVLGPSWQNHVVCRDWSSDVVLYRRDDELFCRSVAPIEIDGQLCEGRGRLAPHSRVVGSDFSMCLEELDRCSRQPLL